MATCKDCVHSPVCRLPFNTSETQVNFAEECNHFKNKADVVEVKKVQGLSTADVVPVVRCKDCKYYYRADKDTCLCTHKKNLTFKTALTISREHYCSYGERRCSG